MSRCQHENPAYPVYDSGFYAGYFLPEACARARQRYVSAAREV